VANDLAAISAALTQEFQPRVTRTVNRKSMAVRLLSIRKGFGQNTIWAVETSGAESTAGAAVEGADISSFAADVRMPASLAWGQYTAAVKQSGIALAAAASTMNPDDLRNLFGRDIDNAANALVSQLNKDFHTQNAGAGGVQPIASFASAVAATGTYAGINKGTTSLWQGVVNANGGTPRPLTLALMRAVRRQLYINGEPPDVILASPAQFDAYGALLDSQRRWVDNLRVDKGLIKLDAGYQALEFEGIPVLRDKDMAAGSMYFINSKHLYWSYLPDALVPGFPAIAEKVAEGSIDEPASLPCAVVALGRTGDSIKAFLKGYYQLICERPNLMGLLSDLS
jgi:hypothetical protein